MIDLMINFIKRIFKILIIKIYKIIIIIIIKLFLKY
jgi:hypothetical protein